MSNQNILGNQQALNSFLQQQTKHIEGQPLRVYPFKIVSGLSYFTNKGQEALGTNFGASYTNADNTGSTNDLGAFSGATTMFSGAKPLMCYWFGVVNSEVDVSYTAPDGVKHEHQIHTTINANPLNNGDQEWEPLPFLNPITQRVETPWKEVGITGYTISNGKVQHGETLDNLKIACYETVYTYTVYSNDWVPTFQEINEFVYFILDVRCPCPVALRIDTVEPHYDELGILQDCQITFESVNQHFNQNGRNVLTYIKFGAVGEGYAFPEERIVGGQVQTLINMRLLKPEYGGVDQICVKNNSLTGQFGALVYGHPYVEFNTQPGVNKLERYTDLDRYLIPYQFTTPIKDSIDVASEVIHDSYDLMLNMVVVNEQIWGNWRGCKQNYNMTQNFTFQGGLSFDDPINPNTSNVLYGAQNTLLNGNSQYNTWTSNSPDRTMLGDGYGSKNLGEVMLSNAGGYSLPYLSLSSNTWTNPKNGAQGAGFNLPPTACLDYRSTWLTVAQAKNPIASTVNAVTFGAMNTINNWFDIYYASGFEPPQNSSNEILSLCNIGGSSSFILAQDFFALNSWSMVNVHQLEINYRDGIVHTNQDQGHNQWFDQISDKFSGIADAFIGYIPGYCDFFLSTYTRTYSLMIPHSLAPLCNQYMNPVSGTYNAIPLDIFANTNDNNTSVGQLKYMSGYQYILTDQFWTNQQESVIVNTARMRGTNNPNQSQLIFKDTSSQEWKEALLNETLTINKQTSSNWDLWAPSNSVIFYKTSAPKQEGVSYVIDEVNIKQLGISNLHVSYYKDVNGKLFNVGEEWLENTAKMMNNTSYIDNDIPYYVYDKYNTTVNTNAEPYLDLQYPADPTWTQKEWKQWKQQITIPDTKGNYYQKVSTSSPVQGVNFTSTYASDVGTLAGSNPASFFDNYCMKHARSNLSWTCYNVSYWAGYVSCQTMIKTAISGNPSTVSYPGWDNQSQYSFISIINHSNPNVKWINPTSNTWWLNECNACSDTPDSNGYLPGTIKGLEIDGFLMDVLPTAYDLTNVPSGWASGYQSVWNIPVLTSGCGIYSPYATTVAYYSFNFTKLISLATFDQNFPVLPMNSTNTLSYNYVLIPHGADPKEYVDNHWAFQGLTNQDFPWVNSKDCVVIIEPGTNTKGQSNYNPGMSNNVPCFANPYGTYYTPLYYLYGEWWDGTNQWNPDLLYLYGLSNFSTYSGWLSLRKTNKVETTGNTTSGSSKTFVGCPMPYIQQCGMGVSFVAQYLVQTNETLYGNPSGNTFDTMTSKVSFSPSWFDNIPNNFYMFNAQNTAGWQLTNQSDVYNFQEGQYDFYIFYSIT